MSQPEIFVSFHDLVPVAVQQGPQGAPELNPSRGQGGGSAPNQPANTSTEQDGTPKKPGAQPGCFDNPQTLLMMVLLFGVMYFLLIRPASKQRKEQAQMQSALSKGDQIVTSGGIHGTISTIGDRTVTLRIDNIKMTVERSAIGRIVRDEPKADAPPAS